jgi:hypothetical protein
MIRCLTGGVCLEFEKLHQAFRELHNTDEVKKLSENEYMKYKVIESVINNTHNFDDKRRMCRSAFEAHYRNPRNEFLIFECLEWLRSINKDINQI